MAFPLSATYTSSCPAVPFRAEGNTDERDPTIRIRRFDAQCAKEPAKRFRDAFRKIITWDASIDSLCYCARWKLPVDESARGVVLRGPILQTSYSAKQKAYWGIKFHGSCNRVPITRIRVGNATLMQHVLFNDTTRRACPSGRSVRVITNIGVYCESGTLSHGTPYPAVIGARLSLSTLLTERSRYPSALLPPHLVPRPSPPHLPTSRVDNP